MAAIVLTVFMAAGCDEGMQMMKPATDGMMNDTDDPSMVGEVKDTPSKTEKPVVAKPSGVELKTASDSGVKGDTVTAENMLTITVNGTVDGATVTVTATKGKDVVIADGTGNGGDLDITIGPLADGVWSVTAMQDTDASKESEPTKPLVITVDTTPPTVTVAWYGDEQLEQSVPDTVRPGDTVYVQVVFSEPVTYTIGDDEDARPALSFVTDGEAVRLRVLPRDADLVSGTCKPSGDGTDVYICMYTVPAIVTLTLQVEPVTADSSGNTVTEAPAYTPSFTIDKPEPVDPEPTDPSPEPDDGLPTREELHQIWADKLKELRSAPDYWDISIDEEIERSDQAFYEVFGFTYEFTVDLVFSVYFKEKPEDYGIIPYQIYDLAVEYRYLQLRNLDATEEELIELLRESIRAGEVTITP